MLATFSRGDVLLCQVTSKPHGHPEVVGLCAEDFAAGGTLPVDSYALAHRLVTAHEEVVRRTVGVLSTAKLTELRAAVVRAVRGELSGKA